MIPILKKIYPQKKDDDFWNNPKTAGLEFIASGLNVDIVPVREINVADYVQQPDAHNNKYITSPKNQLQFISDRKTANTNFTTIVRILKKWRNYHGLALSSFAIELIVSYLDIEYGVENSIEESILRFFKLVSKKQFPVITFNAPYGIYKPDYSHVFVADPTYNENNVTKYVTEGEWKEIKSHASNALDTLCLADEEEYLTPTMELWKEIFGNNFSIDSVIK